MKTLLFTSCALLLGTWAFAQDCFEAKSSAAYAYSHSKQAYESNNRDHLTQFSARALEAFEKAKVAAQNCGCESAFNIAYDGAEVIANAVDVKTWEDGRYYVKKARDLGQELIDELDLCTEQIAEIDPDLSALQNEQLALKQQQLELQKKGEAIKRKLAMQQEQQLRLQKEALISKHKKALKSYRASCQEVLLASGCGSNFANSPETVNVLGLSLEDITAHYNSKVAELSEKLTSLLQSCN